MLLLQPGQHVVQSQPRHLSCCGKAWLGASGTVGVWRSIRAQILDTYSNVLDMWRMRCISLEQRFGAAMPC